MAEAASPSSHSSFCEEVFSVVAGIGDPGCRDHQSRLQPNEVDRTNILAPGFAFFPPSPPKLFGDWPSGKLYPVTAAQLLPSFTGFLAPIHFSKLAKNWDRRLAACASSVKII
jgi:hypothetical protein